MKMLFLKEAVYANKRASPKRLTQRDLTAFLRACAKIKSLRLQFRFLIVGLKFCATREELSHNKRKSCSWKVITYLLGLPGWLARVSLFDLTLMLAVEPREFKRRLVSRWRNLEIPEESILGSVDGNTLRNGTTIL